MQNIPLQAIPNQLITVNLNDNVYNITIKEARGIMASSIVINNELIQEGIRIESGYPLIPYLYQEIGNFILLTMDFEYPYYTNFGITQFLIFANQSELEQIRG